MKKYILKSLVIVIILSVSSTIYPADSTSTLSVEAVLCFGIDERMPMGEIDTIFNDTERIYFWTKITGLSDTTFVIHRWYYGERVMAEVELPVKSPEWRTWSSKKLLPGWIGDWEVKILDDDENILQSIPFVIIKKEATE